MKTQAGGAEQGSQFDNLLSEIAASADVLAKAVDTDEDGKIAAAAAEGGEDTEEGEEGADSVAGGDGDDVMTKSLKVTGPDGAEFDAIDATDLLKSLVAEVSNLKGVVTELSKLTMGNVTLTKSLESGMVKLGGLGRGRKSVVVQVHGRPGGDLTKSLTGGDAAQAGDDLRLGKTEFLAKALELVEAGKLHARDVNHTETLLNRGAQPQEHVVQAVYAAAGVNR